MTNNSTNFTKDLLSIQDDLLRFAYKLTADREDANDLLQETSLKALDNEDKYMPETNFKGWVYMGHRTKRFFQWSGKMGERL